MERLDVLTARPGGARWLLPALTIGLLVAAVAASALFYSRSLDARETIPGIVLGQTRLESLPFSALDRAIDREARRYLAGALTLTVGKHELQVTRSTVGIQVDRAATRRRLEQTGKTGSFLRDLVHRVQARRARLHVGLVPRIDRDRALEYFTRLKEEVDRPAVPPRLDLDKRKVLPGREGYLLNVYDCLAGLELALMRDQRRVPLAVKLLSDSNKNRALEQLDIGHVLARFSTVYSLKVKDKDRAFNLKVGAGKLDGLVLGPGEMFSYNEVVGPRSEAQGYRTAPVISEGEVVDGMAGGSCQLSSTLFAAAFFAGLDLESSRPHTRPSSYIKMGLDATVSYPTIDLKLKNPYPFPVVFHFKVNRGKVRVRILGQQRPWSKVELRRVLKEQVPFKTIVRRDSRVPAGQKVVTQRGVPGFRLVRRRLFYRGSSSEPAKSDERDLWYPPTTEIITEGTGPADPEWERPKEKPPFGEVPEEFTLAQ